MTGQFFDKPFRQAALRGIKAMHHLTSSHLKPGIAIVKDQFRERAESPTLETYRNWSSTHHSSTRPLTGVPTVLVPQNQRILSPRVSGSRVPMSDTGHTTAKKKAPELNTFTAAFSFCFHNCMSCYSFQ